MKKGVIPCRQGLLGIFFSFIRNYVVAWLNVKRHIIFVRAFHHAGGYPWTAIRVEDGNGYLIALESVSADLDLRLFALSGWTLT